MKTDYDVVVVGAGPGGTAAAYQLAQTGFRTLLLDKAAFPRVKPCGGGVTIKALALMPYSVGSVIERATDKLLMSVKTWQGQRSEIFSSAGNMCAFTVRAEFDRLNFAKCIDEGVAFEQINSLKTLDERQDFVTVGFDAKVVTAKYVIGADGANSTVRRLLGAGRYFYRGFAVEGHISYADLSAEPTPEFFFGVVNNGYGWLFPKRTHVNVGIYTRDDGVSLSKDQLRKYALDRVGTDRITDIAGYPLGFGGRGYVPNRERILLVGDAAGFAEPLLGEGIHNALKSGQIAAAAIAATELCNSPGTLRRNYMQALKPLFSDLARCENLSGFFYGNLDSIGSAALRWPISKTALMRGFAAGKTMDEIASTFFLSPFLAPKIPQSLDDFLHGNSTHRRAGKAVHPLSPMTTP
jgi:geranylgeranyl reductase family protein